MKLIHIVCLKSIYGYLSELINYLNLLVSDFANNSLTFITYEEHAIKTVRIPNIAGIKYIINLFKKLKKTVY